MRESIEDVPISAIEYTKAFVIRNGRNFQVRSRFEKAWAKLAQEENATADRCIGAMTRKEMRDALTLRMCSELQRTDRQIADADVLGAINL